MFVDGTVREGCPPDLVPVALQQLEAAHLAAGSGAVAAMEPPDEGAPPQWHSPASAPASSAGLFTKGLDSQAPGPGAEAAATQVSVALQVGGR